MLMKKFFHNWWVIYAIIAIATGVIAFFSKEFWGVVVVLVTTIFHFVSNHKMQWITIEIWDEEGFPGVSQIPAPGYARLHAVKIVNTVLWFVGVAGIFFCLL